MSTFASAPVNADQHTPATQSREIRVLFNFIYVYFRVRELWENAQVPERAVFYQHLHDTEVWGW